MLSDPVVVALIVAQILESCGLRYLVGGSLASSIQKLAAKSDCQATRGSGHAIELIPEFHERFSTLKHRHHGRPRHLNEAS